MNYFDLENLIKTPTYFQSINPTYINLALTNEKKFFKNLIVLEVGIFNHFSFVLNALVTNL